MMKVRKISETIGMPVYTDEGHYYGDIEESIIEGNKVTAWRVRATRNSQLSRVLAGASGVTIPHQFVKAVGDVMLISRNAVPGTEEENSITEKAR